MASGGQIQPTSTSQPTAPEPPSEGGRLTDFKVGTQAFKTQQPSAGVGSLPNIYDQLSPVAVNVVNDYPWTLSNVKTRKDIPYIKLSEHRMNESLLQRQLRFYGLGIAEATANLGLEAANQGSNAVNNSLGSLAKLVNIGLGLAGLSLPTFQGTGTRDILETYDEIWPDNPTNFEYYFPYFSKTQYELTTPQWQQTDAVGQAIAGGLSQAGTAVAQSKGALDKTAINLGTASAIIKGAEAAAEFALKAVYPVAGIVDRPRVFTNHNERTVTIQFPLYNTKGEFDWIYNRRFITTFASQNLFQKRDFITGLPPVYYRVYVPGQYFSFASCVTNFTVENLGNVRLEYEDIIVPDAYQVTITLTEMLMPSLNQYQAVLTGLARERVEIGRK